MHRQIDRLSFVALTIPAGGCFVAPPAQPKVPPIIPIHWVSTGLVRVSRDHAVAGESGSPRAFTNRYPTHLNFMSMQPLLSQIRSSHRFPHP